MFGMFELDIEEIKYLVSAIAPSSRLPATRRLRVMVLVNLHLQFKHSIFDVQRPNSVGYTTVRTSHLTFIGVL